MSKEYGLCIPCVLSDVDGCDEATIDLDVTVTVEREWDDDGCGGPSVTGNSMTGCRGSYPAVQSIDLDMTDAEIAAQVRKAFAKMDLAEHTAIDKLLEGIEDDEA